jgi:hypothetical protein
MIVLFIDRFGKIMRCTCRWYRGACKKVANGEGLFSIALSLNGIALRYCSKQDRANTNKLDVMIDMFKELKGGGYNKYNVDILSILIIMDSWFASNGLKDYQ